MDDHGIEDHPDLMDPEWQRHAEKEAWVGLRATRRRARVRTWVTLSVAGLVALAAAGIAVYLARRPDSSSGVPAAPAATTATTTTTTGSAPTELPDYAHVDLTRPFDKTPAQNWAEGIAGLKTAPAAKVGSFSAAQVAQAEDQVKKAITAAHLDHGTLDGHHPDAYLALFAPDARTDLQSGVQGYVTYLADGYHLLPVAPRLNGTLTVQPGKTGELVLHVSYVVAYAFDPGTQSIEGPSDIEPFVRVEADYIERIGNSWAPASRGLWLEAYHAFDTNIACSASKSGFLMPEFGEPSFDGPSVSPDPGRYDPAKPVPTKGNCGE
ncbi:hypothetical protein [Amycolatopsis jejuensis]|uniref:hypothetical protein n=1 Tax=Amycolatopsis jejuensis TaxID=330084 RepID=UPI0005243696|nr:hypothetical protein [Amycolatopsis jejuensis]